MTDIFSVWLLACKVPCRWLFMCFHHLTQNQVFIHKANFNQMFILLDWRKKYLLCILTSMFSRGLDNYRDWKTGDGCWTSHTIHFLLPLLTSKLSCKHMLLRLSDASVLRCSATYILWRAPPQKCNYSTHQGFRSMWGGQQNCDWPSWAAFCWKSEKLWAG